jgi:hypothetical protein
VAAVLVAAAAFDGRSWVFAGADGCREAGLLLPGKVSRPVFEDGVWDFIDVVGLPLRLAFCTRRFEFAEITDERWRLVGKELVLVMLAPRHPAVAQLPRAPRTVLHLRSCAGRPDELIRFCRWLSEHGVSRLARVGTRICDACMAPGVTSSTSTERSSVGRVRQPAAARHRSSSAWSITVSCSPLSVSRPISDLGRGRRLRRRRNARWAESEDRVRAVMDRLLRGGIPPGGRGGVRTLAGEAAAGRTAFYGTRPYAQLRVGFERRLRALRQAGEIPDPREVRSNGLEEESAELRERLDQSERTVGELTGFRARALARLAAQREETVQLRGTADASNRVTRLPRLPSPRTTVIGSCS